MAAITYEGIESLQGRLMCLADHATDHRDKDPLAIAEIDLGVKYTIAKYLRDAFPGDCVIRQGTDDKYGGQKRVWLVLGIDGPKSFQDRGDTWALGVACWDRDLKEPVYSHLFFPVTGDVLYGGKDIPVQLNGKVLSKLTDAVRDRKFELYIDRSGPDPSKAAEVFANNLYYGAYCSYKDCHSIGYPILQVAQGHTQAYYSAALNGCHAAVAGAIIMHLGGDCRYFWAANYLQREREFLCGIKWVTASAITT